MHTSGRFASFVKPFLAAALGACFPLPAQAVNSSFNGVYSAAGQRTLLFVINGAPRSNVIGNSQQNFINTFKQVTEASLGGTGLTGTYTTEEDANSSVFTVRYYNAADGTLVLTFVSEVKYQILLSTANEFRLRTTWELSYSGDLVPDTIISSDVYDESFNFNGTDFTCRYSEGSGIVIIYRRTSTGTGLTQGSPLIPVNPNWSVTTLIVFPIPDPARVYVLDPPFATAFEYSVAAGRKERISRVTLPRGFGSSIKVLALPSKGGALTLVGTYPSGAKIDLTGNPKFKQGTNKILIRGIKPKADLAKRAPYPVGIAFTNLNQSAAKIKILAKEVTKR